MSTRVKLLVSIAGFLLLQEIVLRLVFPLPELSNFDRAQFVPKKNEFQGGFVRNKSFEWWSLPDTSAPFQLNYNKYGFRDDDWQVGKPQPKKRVMFVGDSFVEGIMVDNDQTIPRFFEISKPAGSIETMNAGMLGTGVQEYLQFIADAVPIFQPDVVMMVIYANDFTSESVSIPSHNLAEEYFDRTTPRLFELLKQNRQGNPVPSIFRFSSPTVLPDSAQPTYPFATRIAEMYNHADSTIVSAMLRARFNPYKLNEIIRMERALREPCNLLVPLDFFKFYSEKHSFEPVVVFIPCRHQVTDNYLEFEYAVSKRFDRTIRLTDSKYQLNVELLKRNCHELGLKLIDTSDTLKQMEIEGLHTFWNYDDHMRVEGYHAVGQFVADHWN